MMIAIPKSLQLKIHAPANDWISKGFHVTVDGVELAMKPGQNGTIVFDSVFSSTPANKVQNAIKQTQALLDNPKTIETLVQKGYDAREYLKTFGTQTATAKSGEVNFLIKALEKLIK